MQIQMLLVGGDRSPLETIALGCLDPQLAGLADRDALAVWRVHAVGDLNLRVRREPVGILLFEEGAHVPLAVDGVVDDPRSLVLALRRGPGALADAHGSFLFIAASTSRRIASERF